MILRLILVASLAVEGLCAVFTMVPCEPGELVFIDCNLCTCNRQGFPNQVCARMWCPPPPKSQQNLTAPAATVPGSPSEQGKAPWIEDGEDSPDKPPEPVSNAL